MQIKEDKDLDPLKFPKRALTIASVALTLIFILFFASLLASVFQIQWRIEQSSTSYAGGILTITLPINITNAGYYDINNFTIYTAASDDNGLLFSSSSTFPTIKSQSAVVFEHNTPINLTDFFATHRNYLFNRATFQSVENVSLTIGGMVPVSLAINHTMSWGAPLTNLNVATPTVTPLNYTHVQVSSNIRFFNDAVFPVAGTLVLTAYNNTQPLASASYPLNTPSGTNCDVTLLFVLPISPQPTRFSLELQTLYFALEVPING
jgi:hypothetical protein